MDSNTLLSLPDENLSTLKVLIQHWLGVQVTAAQGLDSALVRYASDCRSRS